MKAYVLKGINDLCYEDVDVPECPEGWAIVDVKAVGICSSDIPRIFTKGTYHFPTIPGHEFAGVVSSLGSETDNHLSGKHVGVFPLIPCRHCAQCAEGHYEMCENYDYVGSRRDGGFAEKVAVPVWNLIELPEQISMREAAMLEPLAVAYHALSVGGIDEGNTVGIVGTGMIGFAAAQWAKEMGAVSVTVVGRNDKKRSIAEATGVQYTTVLNKEPLFDFVLEAVGTNESLDYAINHVKPGGKIVLMGNPEGEMHLSQNSYWRILRKQLRLYGTWNSMYEKDMNSDWQKVVDALAAGRINVAGLISHVFSQEDLMKGLDLMHNHLETYCKVIVEWNQEE